MYSCGGIRLQASVGQASCYSTLSRHIVKNCLLFFSLREEDQETLLREIPANRGKIMAKVAR
jgi:hypothetical protein